jgi:hypothetical protein
MLKKISLIVLVLALALPLRPEPWGNQTITVTAGTAQRLNVAQGTLATSLFAQMLPASSGGVGYLLFAQHGVTCSNGGAGTTLIATLAAATSTAPGGNVTIPFPASPQNPKIDVSLYCFDGATSGNTIGVSFNLSN